MCGKATSHYHQIHQKYYSLMEKMAAVCDSSFSVWKKPREISHQPAAAGRCLKAVGWAFLWHWQPRLKQVQWNLHWWAGHYRVVGWGGAAHWPCSSRCSFPSAGSDEGDHAAFSSASCAWNTETILIDKRRAAAPLSILMLVIIM